MNVTVTSSFVDGSVAGSWETENDGHGVTLIPGDQDLTEYVASVACADGTCANASYAVLVSSSPPPSPTPTSAPSATPTTAAPSAAPTSAPAGVRRV